MRGALPDSAFMLVKEPLCASWARRSSSLLERPSFDRNSGGENGLRFHKVSAACSRRDALTIVDVRLLRDRTLFDSVTFVRVCENFSTRARP